MTKLLGWQEEFGVWMRQTATELNPFRIVWAFVSENPTRYLSELLRFYTILSNAAGKPDGPH
ncbi:hypothetical protein [Aquabacterium sp.]|uniref:hypothetical protein n=1 Tax=Aquabacterium sp. TaxID=1872578 RepID=UPI0035B38713